MIRIPFQLNPTENFTILINNYVVVFNALIRWLEFFSNNFGAKCFDVNVECCWSCEVTRKFWCVSCGEIIVIRKVFY